MIVGTADGRQPAWLYQSIAADGSQSVQSGCGARDGGGISLRSTTASPPRRVGVQIQRSTKQTGPGTIAACVRKTLFWVPIRYIVYCIR
jgi:hypothetical protein